MTSTTAKRFTIEDYHRLAELGFFTADDRVELIRGEIMQMAAKGTAPTNPRFIKSFSSNLNQLFLSCTIRHDSTVKICII